MNIRDSSLWRRYSALATIEIKASCPMTLGGIVRNKASLLFPVSLSFPFFGERRGYRRHFFSL